MADTHYTAVLEVQKVTTTPPTTKTNHRGYDPVTVPGSRDVSEVARVVVRADTLEVLSMKLSGHIGLIAE